jgi:hypothetical protein
VEFRCGVSLHRLLRSLSATIDFSDINVDVAEGVLPVPLMSLPHLLRESVPLIPVEIPYLRPEPELRAKWALRLGGKDRRVGINWQGRSSYAEDSQRSVPLRFFEPLAHIEDIKLFSLQRGDGIEQLAEKSVTFRVEPLGDEYDADEKKRFMDAAAVIANLDLVVTSDTAIAHLAGALGKPVFVALGFVPDWRWMDAGERTPWYPSMRLFRQTERGDWAGVFQRIAMAAKEMFAAGRTVSGDYNPFFDYPSS